MAWYPLHGCSFSWQDGCKSGFEEDFSLFKWERVIFTGCIWLIRNHKTFFFFYSKHCECSFQILFLRTQGLPWSEEKDLETQTLVLAPEFLILTRAALPSALLNSNMLHLQTVLQNRFAALKISFTPGEERLIKRRKQNGEDWGSEPRCGSQLVFSTNSFFLFRF